MAIVFIGDELTAAGFRLTGIETLVNVFTRAARS
jgi:vacuolar-type H+-ATPase subunit F/Vma7